MHACRRGRAVFTLSGLVSSAREASDRGARARRQTQAKLRRSWQKDLTDADTRPKGAVTSTHQCYSRRVTADYSRAFPFHVAFSRWSTKQKAFKRCSSADGAEGLLSKRYWMETGFDTNNLKVPPAKQFFFFISNLYTVGCPCGFFF